MAERLSINDIFGGNSIESEVEDEMYIIDNDWVKSRFMASDDDLNDLDAKNRYYSTASLKFTDSAIGGNIGINPRPQFTRYADIRQKGSVFRDEVTINGRSNNLGMGRYYSEAIDDNAQTVFLEFGLPKFNSLLDFFTRAIDYEQSVVANTGRSPMMYKLGRFLGAGVMLAAFPMITLTVWTLKFATKLISSSNSFDYYYLEPSMHMYWGAVNDIVTRLTIEMGIMVPEFMPDRSEAGKMGIPVKIKQEDLEEMNDIIPGIINDNNYIDVYAIATRAQTLANRQMLKEYEKYQSGDINEYDFEGYVKGPYSVKESDSAGAGLEASMNAGITFSKFLDKTTKGGGLYANKGDAEETKGDVNKEEMKKGIPKDKQKLSKNVDGTYDIEETEEEKSYTQKFVEAMDAGARDGGLHAIFYVNYTGEVSESFSNTTGSIGTGETINQVGGKARDLRFDAAGGNITSGINDLLGGVKDFAAGVLDSVSFGLSNVIQTLAGGGYIDIPKKWEDSSMELPTITYEMELISPYNDPISQLQNIYIPLAMLMAGTLPLSTGKSSYTSPFLCSLFSKGVQQVDLGMITALNITRGTSNLGFDKKRRPLAINVSFTVTDFSSIMTAPVNTSIFDVFNVAMDDTSPLGRYISVLGSRDLSTNKYMIPRIKLRASRLLMKQEQSISPASWGLRTGGVLSNIIGGVTSTHSLTLQHQN